MATEIYVGKKFEPLEFIASPERIREYIDGVLDYHPWYSGESPFGGPVAPALIFHSISPMFQGWWFDNKFGTLYTRQEWTLSGVLRPGQKATATATMCPFSTAATATRMGRLDDDPAIDFDSIAIRRANRADSHLFLRLI